MSITDTLLSDRSPQQGGHSTLLLVQWALALACTYMVLFSESSDGIAGWGSVVVLLFLVTNLAIGRLDFETAQGRSTIAAIGLIDAVLIIASLQAAGQLSVELVLLCLGIVILAVAGLPLATIAVGSMALLAVYTTIVIVAGDSPWQSGTLLRLPFLFIAAVVYAWFVSLGAQSEGSSTGRTVSRVAEDLASQRQAIERCRQALGNGSTGAAESALAEIENRMHALERSLAQA